MTSYRKDSLVPFETFVAMKIFTDQLKNIQYPPRLAAAAPPPPPPPRFPPPLLRGPGIAQFEPDLSFGLWGFPGLGEFFKDRISLLWTNGLKRTSNSLRCVIDIALSALPWC